MRREPTQWDVLTSRLNRLSSALSTSVWSGFRNRFIFIAFYSNAVIILVLHLKIIWIVEFTRPNPVRVSFVSVPPPLPNQFFFFYNYFNFFFDAQNLVQVTVAILSLYHSPVEKQKELYAHSELLPLLLSFSCQEFIQLPVIRVKRLAFSRTAKWFNFQNSVFLGKLYWTEYQQCRCIRGIWCFFSLLGRSTPARRFASITLYDGRL